MVTYICKLQLFLLIDIEHLHQAAWLVHQDIAHQWRPYTIKSAWLLSIALLPVSCAEYYM